MTMSDLETVTIFAALEPGAALHCLVQGYKDETRALVGEQLYLADPPHLTLYLAVYPTAQAALSCWQTLPTQEVDVTVNIPGWQVFEADALTGNHTLVCDLAADDKSRLRLLQKQVVACLAPARDAAATEVRLAPRLNNLTDVQRTAVASHGFPYLGDGWEPHFTIASIRTSDWPRVWQALADRPPRGVFHCPRARLYKLVDGVPVAIDGPGEHP
jgi:2'-5' RNA ligase